MEWISQVPVGTESDVDSRKQIYTRYNVQILTLRTVKWNDGRVASSALGGKYVITSPNLDFIPQPPEGRITVSTKVDGKYGKEDPLHHPQLYDDDFRVCYLSCIPRPTHPMRHPEIWVVPSKEDYEAITAKGAAQLCVLVASRLSPIEEAVESLFGELIEYEAEYQDSQHLRWLVVSAKHAYERLCHPATRRDLLRQLVSVERHYCMALAWIIWHGSFRDIAVKPARVQETLMGCFTTDGSVAAKLTQVGIPVWYMRLGETFVRSCNIVINVVDITPPTDVPTTECSPRNVVYVGIPGIKQLETIYQKGHTYADIEAVPLPEDFASNESTPVNESSTTGTITRREESSLGVQRRERSGTARHPPCKYSKANT